MAQFHHDLEMVPLVYSSSGVNVDFAKHKTGTIDADLISDTLMNVEMEDPPVTLLEKSDVATGAAQTIVYDMPSYQQFNMSGIPRLVALDIAMQLNTQTLPKTDFTFNITYLNAFGRSLTDELQLITGNAAVQDGDTRQYVRVLPLMQNSSFSSGLTADTQDGKSIHLPSLGAVSPAILAKLEASSAPVWTPDELEQLFPHLSHNVAQIAINLPVNGVSAGVGITLTPITAGRRETVYDIIDSLDTLKDASAAPPADESSAGSQSFAQQVANAITS
jgi:hypothetical protein